jgi:2-polyprenyl-3-methyl-5-hydroxy-6-metoxy-1,4-benzoquinol methylase
MSHLRGRGPAPLTHAAAADLERVSIAMSSSSVARYRSGVPPLRRDSAGDLDGDGYGRIFPAHSAFVQGSATDHEFTYRPILDVLQPMQGKRILDFGSGPGFLSQKLAASGAEVVGVDPSFESVAAAQRKYGPAQFPTLSFKVIPEGDLSALRGRGFDAAVCSYVLCSESDPSAIVGILSGIREALKPDGKLVVVNANWDKSNGADFVSWEMPRVENLKSGDPVISILKGQNGHPDIEVQDFYWSVDDQRSMLEQSGFEIESVMEPTADDQGEEAEKWKDEKSRPPNLIITARLAGSEQSDRFPEGTRTAPEPVALQPPLSQEAAPSLELRADGGHGNR